MRVNGKLDKLLGQEAIFCIQQWVALFVGISCIAVSLWSALTNHAGLSFRHLSVFGGGAPIAMRWLLMIVVGILGAKLVHFALRGCELPDADRILTPDHPSRAREVSAKGRHRSKLLVGESGRK
jgi:hypothetical protein